MLRSAVKLGLVIFASLFLVAATPFQVGEEFLGLPIWAWVLIAIGLFLVATFVVFIAFDWSSGAESDENE